MERNTPELALDSLFIDKIEHRFTMADAGLLTSVHAFSREKHGRSDPESLQAARLLLGHGADAVTIASALLAPLLWQALVQIGDIRRRFGPPVASMLEDLDSPLTLSSDSGQHLREEAHADRKSVV